MLSFDQKKKKKVIQCCRFQPLSICITKFTHYIFGFANDVTALIERYTNGRCNNISTNSSYQQDQHSKYVAR
ncbi:hypothetical protein EUGRSUZ_E03966 [Eucalyptus grandis]|uniref:Uncharacterized protein n=2 Tax=Eucalyptus grandis TaxID=71139 RepID=A0ACC3L115_EUCGR|nr:hypothetical protein EUGRSUZ_E03966 [Eucalyptus grandis]